ncbi:MAG: DUF6290 family protein [Coriobacteriales bacterium]|jgi:predicted DNA-binding protein|nr:DUF6290 family protein [Coriobacteriales bacterium]
MSMTVSAVRFDPEEKEWISSIAAKNGKSFSSQVREWALERLEDELDALDLAAAIKENAGRPGRSWEDVKADLGI